MDGAQDRRVARREATSIKVLDAALRCFAEEGYTTTTMSRIGELAEVSKGAVFYSYPTKADLYEKVLRQAVAALSQRVDVASEGKQGWVALDAAIHGLLEHAVEHPTQSRFVLSEIVRNDSPCADALPSIRAELALPLERVLLEVIAQRLDSGALDSVRNEPFDLSAHVHSVAMGLIGAMVVTALDRAAGTGDIETLHAGIMLIVSALKPDELGGGEAVHADG